MRSLMVAALIVVTSFFYTSTAAHAESEAACAIWLCLPAGFPSGCSAAHSEFRHRIKKGKPPLPAFSSCAVGGSTGHYEMGYDKFEDCGTDYEAVTDYVGQGKFIKEACVSKYCQAQYQWKGIGKCDVFVRQPRTKPNFVKMWVDGEFVGQYYF